MSDNSRFHSKFHRKNHHTLPTAGFPDSGKDPIASQTEPFQGDMYVNGIVRPNDVILGVVSLLAKINDLVAHIANTSNPHNVTAAQVGLATVPASIVDLQNQINALILTVGGLPTNSSLPTVYKIADSSDLTTLTTAKPTDFAIVGTVATDYTIYVLIPDDTDVPNSYASVDNWVLLEDSALIESISTISSDLSTLTTAVGTLATTVGLIPSNYINKDGSVAMTGAFNANNNNIIVLPDVDVRDVAINNPANVGSGGIVAGNALSVNSYLNTAFGDASTASGIGYREDPSNPGVWAWFDDSNTILTSGANWTISGATMTLIAPVKVGYFYLEHNAVLNSYTPGTIERQMVRQKARKYVAWKIGDTVTFNGNFVGVDYLPVTDYASLP